MNSPDKPMNSSLNSIVASANEQFESRYRRTPNIVVAAPGRVNLIGEHIDYNDGYVLPMAIERYVVIAAGLRDSPAVSTAEFYSAVLKESESLPLDSRLKPGVQGWSAYIAGVIAGFQNRNIEIPAFDAVVQSNLRIGGGLSSSAALEVAVATLLETITGYTIDPVEKALLCQKAEHEFAGVPCGIMDQFSCVFGKQNELMLIDCQTQEIEAIPFDTEEVTILVTTTNANHKLIDGEYATRRAQCDFALAKLNKKSWREIKMEDLKTAQDRLTNIEYRRVRHVVTEIQRTTQAAKAFATRDWRYVGNLMIASHASLRDDFEVSCAELDTLVDIASKMNESVYGSRMTGAGFGGSIVTLVKSEDAAEVQDALIAKYQQKTGITPHSFVSRPAQGAYIIASNQ